MGEREATESLPTGTTFTGYVEPKDGKIHVLKLIQVETVYDVFAETGVKWWVTVEDENDVKEVSDLTETVRTLKLDAVNELKLTHELERRSELARHAKKLDLQGLTQARYLSEEEEDKVNRILKEEARIFEEEQNRVPAGMYCSAKDMSAKRGKKVAAKIAAWEKSFKK